MTMNYQNTHWLDKKVIIGTGDLNPQQPIHLVMGFHGADSTPENMLIHGNKLNIQNAIMIYPEGPVDAGEGLWSWWLDGPKQKESVDEFVLFAQKMIDQAHQHISSENNSAPTRTSLWGFSQGGAASLIYTLYGQHDLHRVATVCGFLPELPENRTKNSKTTSVLGIYGSNDEFVPSFLADYALDEMKGHGHLCVAQETSQGHEINTDNLRDLTEFFNKS